jgi:hypothetical protein
LAESEDLQFSLAPDGAEFRVIVVEASTYGSEGWLVGVDYLNTLTSLFLGLDFKSRAAIRNTGTELWLEDTI